MAPTRTRASPGIDPAALFGPVASVARAAAAVAVVEGTPSIAPSATSVAASPRSLTAFLALLLAGQHLAAGSIVVAPAGSSTGVGLAPSASATSAVPQRRPAARPMPRPARRTVAPSCYRAGTPSGHPMLVSVLGTAARLRLVASHGSRMPIPSGGPALRTAEGPARRPQVGSRARRRTPVSGTTAGASTPPCPASRPSGTATVPGSPLLVTVAPGARSTSAVTGEAPADRKRLSS